MAQFLGGRGRGQRFLGGQALAISPHEVLKFNARGNLTFDGSEVEAFAVEVAASTAQSLGLAGWRWSSGLARRKGGAMR